MNEYDDRLLDHALEELLGEDQGRDLAPRIVEAWRRGERGSLAPEEVALLFEAESGRASLDAARNGRPTLRPLPPVPRAEPVPVSRPRWKAAAAAALLLGGFTWFWVSVGGEEDGQEPARGPSVADATPDAAPVPSPTDPGPPSEDAVERFDDLFAQLYLPGKGRATWSTLAYADRLPAMRALSSLIRGRGPFWERYDGRVAELLDENSQDPAARNERAWILGTTLDFLQQDGTREALVLARRLWLEAPESFEAIHVVGFAEMGAFEFERECIDVLELYDPAVDAPPVHVAAYFAFQGEELGRQALLETCAYPDPDGLDNCLLACLALERIGDEDAWGRAIVRIHELVEGFLSESDLVMACEVVLLFEHYVRVREGGEDTVAGVTRGIFPHLAERRTEVATEPQIRALLTELSGG